MAAKKKPKAKPAPTKPQAKAKVKAKVKAKAAKPPAEKPATKAASKAKGKPGATKAKVTLPAKLKKTAAKPATKTTAKPKPKAQAKAAEPTLIKTVKRAAQKVAQVAAQAVTKLMDADAGKPAPEFELSDEKGETVSSSSLAGKPYLLYFYPKDDTPGCTKEACDIRDNFGRFGQQGMRVLGVSPDTTASHAKFGKKYGLPFTLLSDPEKTLANAYGVWGMKQNYGKEYMGIIRSTFLVGPDGLIKKAYRGVKVDGHVDAILRDAQALL
jgi:thioredoxin-dependent peroxiredoxin